MGLQNGFVVNLRIEIETIGLVQDEEDGKQFESKNSKETVLKLDWGKTWNFDSLLCQYHYLQSDDDTPFFDVRVN